MKDGRLWLQDNKVIHVEEDKLYIYRNYQAEKNSATLLKELSQKLQPNTPSYSSDRETLNAEQLEAVNSILKNPITLIHGLGGTGNVVITSIEFSGKSYTVATLVRHLEYLWGRDTVLVTAPTGRAARLLASKIDVKLIYVTLQSIIL